MEQAIPPATPASTPNISVARIVRVMVRKSARDKARAPVMSLILMRPVTAMMIVAASVA